MLLGHTLTSEDFVIEKKYKKEFTSDHLELGGDGDFILLLDCSQDEKLKNKGLLRELTSQVQKTKKSSGLKVDDDVIIFWDVTKAPKLAAAIDADSESVLKTLKKPFKNLSEKPEGLNVVPNSEKEFEVEGEQLKIVIYYA